MKSSDTAEPGLSPTAAIAYARSLLATSPELAEHQAREVLKVLPDDARALAIVGAARRRSGDLTAARQVLSLVAARRPEVEQAGWEFALTLAALGEGQEAVARLRNLARTPGAAVDWLAAADEFMLAGEPAETVARAEHMRGFARGAQTLASVDALRAGRARDAALMAAALLRGAGADDVAFWVLAEAKLALGQAEEAADVVERMMARAPDLPGIRLAPPRIALAAGRAAQALDLVAACAPEERASGAARFLSARCRLQLGEAGDAAEVAETLVAAYPSYGRLWALRAAALRAAGRDEDADAALARAAALRPDRVEAWRMADTL